MYLAIDIVYVYAVLYRSIYHLKYKGSYGGSNTQYAGHLGVPIPKSRSLLKSHLFENLTELSAVVISFRCMGREPTAPMTVKCKE
jgi:hypothetical protein